MIPDSRVRTIWKPFETGVTGTQLARPVFSVRRASPASRAMASAARGLLLVVYAHEKESLGRGGLACCTPIPGRQDFCETLGSAFAQPHFYHRSHYRADHMLEKPVCVGLNVNLVVVADDCESLQMADGIVVVRETSLEGGKVLRSDQRCCCLLHGSFIQRFVDVPDKRAIDGGTGWAMEYPIGVELASCIVLGMKTVIHEGRGANGNVFWQHGIERAHPVGSGPIQVSEKTRHLSARMHAGVCAACADDGYRGLADLSDGLFDGFLDREVIGLPLPPGVAGPVVLQD